MNTDKTTLSILSIDNNGNEASFFSNREFTLNGSPERFLSAGDPTLILVLTGILRIELRSGKYQDFTAGEMFIANDYLTADVEFNETLHGHRAEVVGAQELKALHLKLEKRAI